MTERVKIKCDDCKFVDDCVDYGWQGCKKFTPAPSTPMTNEEWFCQLPTEEKAHFLSVECARAMCEQQLKITNRNTVDYWKMWLKQPHAIKE